MAQIAHETHDMKETIDKQILKRLLAYAKPFIGYIALSLFLLLGVVAVELVRPILVGNAIDEIIQNYKKPLVYKEGEYQVASLDDVDQVATLVYNDQAGYLLVDGVATDQFDAFHKNRQIEGQGDQWQVVFKEAVYPVTRVNKDELEAFRQEDMDRLIRVMLIFLGITFLGFIVSYFQMILLHYTGQKIIYNIRSEIFTHIQDLNIQFFNQQPVGKIVTRITNDTERLNEMYTSVIVNSVKSILMLVGIATMMFLLDYKLTLFVFSVLPLIVLASYVFRRFSRQAYRDVRTKVSAINAFLSEHISGMTLVQIFAKEKQKMREFDEVNTGLLKANLKQLRIFSIFRPSMYVLYILALALVLGFGGNRVMAGVLSIGTLVVFIQYISNFFDPIQQLSEQFNILQSAMASAEKIFDILDVEDKIEDEAGALELDEIKGTIEFKNVWFAYEKENWILKDVSFKVNPGETVAFVGATGAGKTSILNLISRYYEIQKGEILIDGVNIQKIKKSYLRQVIGQMLQDVFLFTGTIESNIRLKNKDLAMATIEKVSKYVNAHEFIKRLPDRYQEKVYERGATYSAGQRQLLSFARTLADDPDILILDEATANIDTETEVLIQDALKKMMAGRTTLVVAHRLSTIQHADQIIVLHKGVIKEIGNHQTLLQKKGLYHQLYELQYKDQQSKEIKGD